MAEWPHTAVDENQPGQAAPGQRHDGLSRRVLGRAPDPPGRPLPALSARRAQGFCRNPAMATTRSKRSSSRSRRDDGAIGIGGPIPREQAFIVDTELRPLLLGADPLAHEVLWDIMYRASVHGRKGTPMMAISAVDCALWDLKGRVFGAAGVSHPGRAEPHRNPGLRQRPRLLHRARAKPPNARATSSSRASKRPSGSSAMARRTARRAWSRTPSW